MESERVMEIATKLASLREERERVEKLAELMERILSGQCPSGEYEEDDPIRTFAIELHCVTYSIQAKFLGWDEETERGRYEILGYEVR